VWGTVPAGAVPGYKYPHTVYESSGIVAVVLRTRGMRKIRKKGVVRKVCKKGVPCGGTCISSQKVCLVKSAKFRELLFLKNLITKQDVIPPELRATHAELRATHGDRTGEEVANVALNQTEAITKRLDKEQRRLEILQQQYETAKAKYLEQNPDDKQLANWADHPKWYNKVTKAKLAVRVLREERDELTKSIIQVPENRRMTIEELDIKALGNEERKVLQEAYTEISAFIDKSLQPKKSVLLKLTDESPNYYTNFLSISRINISSSSPDKVETLAHEYVHHLEAVNPELSDVVNAFFEKRTKGEKITKFGYLKRDKYPVKRDKFIDPYMGRVYEDDPRAREVLTVAIEEMIRNPYEFMKKDPEHFAFAYDALRGNFAHLREKYKEFLPPNPSQ
jgi:hypothetical protein